MAFGNNGTLEEALSKMRQPNIEELVIGTLLQYSTEETNRAIDSLGVGAFTNKDYEKLFEIIKVLKENKSPINIQSVSTELNKKYDTKEVERLVYVSMDATSKVYSSFDLPYYAATLRNLYTRRELITNKDEAIKGYADLNIPLEDTFNKEEESKKLLQTDREAKYSYLLKGNVEADLTERMKNKQGEIPTLYEFNNPYTGEKERLTLPSGAITFVVAPTSHGKSTFLQNLALQVATNGKEGVTLYFTFEEDGDSVTLQMINKYVNTELCCNYNSTHSNNLRAITHYYRKGEDRYIKGEFVPVFKQKKEEFFHRLYNTGKLKIFYEDYDSTELIEAIRYFASQTKVKAVFIDYIQLLSKRGCRLQRTEELKEICKDFKNLCVETQLPIVVAAQANREVTSPLEMHSQKIAEAADLERIANKIIFVWNSVFKAQKSKDSKSELENFETRTGITLGTSGRMYAKLTKNRGGLVGIEAILKYNGNTGVIEPNCDPVDEAAQSEIQYEQNTDEDNDPF